MILSAKSELVKILQRELLGENIKLKSKRKSTVTGNKKKGPRIELVQMAHQEISLEVEKDFEQSDTLLYQYEYILSKCFPQLMLRRCSLPGMLPSFSFFAHCVLLISGVSASSTKDLISYVKNTGEFISKTSYFFGKVLLGSSMSDDDMRTFKNIVSSITYGRDRLPIIEEAFLKSCGKRNLSYIMQTFPHMTYIESAMEVQDDPCEGLKSYDECIFKVMQNYSLEGQDAQDEDRDYWMKKWDLELKEFNQLRHTKFVREKLLKTKNDEKTGPRIELVSMNHQELVVEKVLEQSDPVVKDSISPLKKEDAIFKVIEENHVSKWELNLSSFIVDEYEPNLNPEHKQVSTDEYLLDEYPSLYICHNTDKDDNNAGVADPEPVNVPSNSWWSYISWN